MRIINIYSMNGEIFFYKTKTKKIDAQVMEQRGRCHVYATYSDFMQTVFPHAVVLHASQIITPLRRRFIIRRHLPRKDEADAAEAVPVPYGTAN